MSDSNLDEARDQTWQDMIGMVMDLCINFGVMNAVMEQYPEEVQANFIERMANVVTFAADQIEELHQFGEAYDDDPTNQ